MAASITSLNTSFKNPGYSSVRINTGAVAVKGTVYSFGSRVAVALEDGAVDEFASYGFGGEWQFALTQVGGTPAGGGKLYSDDTGALSASGTIQVGLITSVNTEVVTALFF